MPNIPIPVALSPRTPALKKEVPAAYLGGPVPSIARIPAALDAALEVLAYIPYVAPDPPKAMPSTPMAPSVVELTRPNTPRAPTPEAPTERPVTPVPVPECLPTTPLPTLPVDVCSPKTPAVSATLELTRPWTPAPLASALKPNTPSPPVTDVPLTAVPLCTATETPHAPLQPVLELEKCAVPPGELFVKSNELDG